MQLHAQNPLHSPTPSDSAPRRRKDNTHRLRVQAGISPGTAVSPRPPQSSASPAQVQAAAQGARVPGSAVSVWVPSSSSQSRSRQGARHGAPGAPPAGRAILSGARRELRRGICEVPGAPAGLHTALGCAPGHSRRPKLLPRQRASGRSKAPGGGRETLAHTGRAARARRKLRRPGQRNWGRTPTPPARSSPLRSSGSRQAPLQPPPQPQEKRSASQPERGVGGHLPQRSHRTAGDLGWTADPRTSLSGRREQSTETAQLL